MPSLCRGCSWCPVLVPRALAGAPCSCWCPVLVHFYCWCPVLVLVPCAGAPCSCWCPVLVHLYSWCPALVLAPRAGALCCCWCPVLVHCYCWCPVLLLVPRVGALCCALAVQRVRWLQITQAAVAHYVHGNGNEVAGAHTLAHTHTCVLITIPHTCMSPVLVGGR